MLTHYLSRLGFDEKDQTIYTTLAQIGVQPASVIARRCRLDRVTTYKHLKRLAERGFIKVYMEHATQRFGVESFDQIETYLRDQSKDVSELLEQLPTALQMLKAFQGDQQMIPRLQLFEGEAGIRSCFRDLLIEAKRQDIRRIRMLTSNTFDERLGDVPLSRFVQELFEELRKRKITVELFEAAGTLIPERLQRVSFSRVNPDKLPAARGATNIVLVGQVVYLACYQRSQIGLKITHAEISQIFHFLFDMMDRGAV